jgi:SRSO17 transposase
VISALYTFVGPYLNGDDGIWVLEDIGFSKRGSKSVGVARQHNPRLDRKDNCQVGVLLSYASGRGEAVLDTRLYLPQSWTSNRPRCQRAGVPDTVTYHSYERGHLYSRWVTGSRTFGRNTSFRDRLDAGGWWYVLEVPLSLAVAVGPTVSAEQAGLTRRGRADTVLHAPRVHMIGSLAAQLPPTAWQRATGEVSAQSACAYHYATIRVRECRMWGLGSECWLVLRRNTDGGDLVAMLSNAPEVIPSNLLSQVSALYRSSAVTPAAQYRSLGLAEYETRSWRGFHHHTTLCLLAGAFLVELQHAKR